MRYLAIVLALVGFVATAPAKAQLSRSCELAFNNLQSAMQPIPSHINYMSFQLDHDNFPGFINAFGDYATVFGKSLKSFSNVVQCLPQVSCDGIIDSVEIAIAAIQAPAGKVEQSIRLYRADEFSRPIQLKFVGDAIEFTRHSDAVLQLMATALSCTITVEIPHDFHLMLDENWVQQIIDNAPAARN